MKEMYYLMTHSTHFIYGFGHMLNDWSDDERENPLLSLHGLLILNELLVNSASALQLV